MKTVTNHPLLLIIFVLGLIGITPNRMLALNPGDIAIIRVNTDNPDAFAFVVLEDIPSHEVIYFTDRGWKEIDKQFRLGEGTLTYTAPLGGLSSGRVITIEKQTGGQNLSVGTTADTRIVDWIASAGSVTDDGGFFLGTDGDQLLAYQGPEAAPTFIYGVQTNSTQWQTGNLNDAKLSALPDGLVEGLTAVALGAGPGNEEAYENVNYDLSTIAGSKTEILTQVSKYENWQKNDQNRYISSIPNFSVSAFPIELLGFSANLDGREVALKWSTASELNNAFFTLERSEDGLSFSPLNRVEGSGTTTAVRNYSAIDYSPLAQVNYYRLKQTDFDGTYTHSHVIKINMSDASASLSIEQLMVREGLINLTIRNVQTSRINLKMYDITGNLIYHQNLNDVHDIETHKIPMGSHTHGAYFLKISNGTERPLTKKIIY